MGVHGLLTATAGFFLVGVSVTLGHTGDRVVPFYEITEELRETIDLTDGSIEDWKEVGPPSLTLLDFFVSENPNFSNTSQRHPGDLDIQIWLGWMKSPPRIYVAAVRADDAYVNEYPDAWEFMEWYDSIALGIDGDHSGGELHSTVGYESEEGFLSHCKQAQLYHALPEVPYGRNVQLMWSFLWEWERWVEEPPFSLGGGAVAGENPFVSITEFYVTPFDLFVYNSPEESVESELYAGKTIGFRFFVHDVDSKSSSVSYQAVYDLQPDPAATFPLFNDGILLGADDLSGQDAGDGSVVKPDSWARIKASFGE